MEIIRVLDDAGADISRVIMGHMDRTGLSPAAIQEIAGTGCYLEYDIFGGNPDLWRPFCTYHPRNSRGVRY